jgi:hypothetical protein
MYNNSAFVTMAKPATNIHIPLSTNEAISLIARVKPDATMPRPGATKSKAKPKRKRANKAKDES